MDLIDRMRNKSDVYIINIIKQRDNNSKEMYEAAKAIFIERGLSLEQAKNLMENKSSAIKELREYMLRGESKENLRAFLLDNNIPSAELDQTISTSYKSFESELNEDFKSRRRYYIYVIFWIIGFSIFLIITLQRFMGDSLLMLNFLLVIPFFYLRFKPIFKLRAIRVANRDHKYEME